MSKLDIQITQAKLISYSVELNDDKPEVTATIGLYTEGGKQITSYSIRTSEWTPEATKFELPVTAIAPILGVAQELEKVVTKHCRDAQKVIEAPSV